MEQEKIDRINALARKAKTVGLSPLELEERELLRWEYIAAIKASLTSHLDNTWVVDEHGNKRPLRKKQQG